MSILDLDEALKWRGNTLYLGSLGVAKVKPPKGTPIAGIEQAKHECETAVRKMLSEIAS